MKNIYIFHLRIPIKEILTKNRRQENNAKCLSCLVLTVPRFSSLDPSYLRKQTGGGETRKTAQGGGGCVRFACGGGCG